MVIGWDVWTQAGNAGDTWAARSGTTPSGTPTGPLRCFDLFDSSRRDCGYNSLDSCPPSRSKCSWWSQPRHVFQAYQILSLRATVNRKSNLPRPNQEPCRKAPLYHTEYECSLFCRTLYICWNVHWLALVRIQVRRLQNNFFLSFGHAMRIPVSQQFIAEIAHPDVRGLLTALHMLMFPVGTLISYVIGAIASWQVLFWSCAGKKRFYTTAWLETIVRGSLGPPPRMDPGSAAIGEVHFRPDFQEHPTNRCFDVMLYQCSVSGGVGMA